MLIVINFNTLFGSPDSADACSSTESSFSQIPQAGKDSAPPLTAARGQPSQVAPLLFVVDRRLMLLTKSLKMKVRVDATPEVVDGFGRPRNSITSYVTSTSSKNFSQMRPRVRRISPDGDEGSKAFY